jgi:hypothetical protein
VSDHSNCKTSTQDSRISKTTVTSRRLDLPHALTLQMQRCVPIECALHEACDSHVPSTSIAKQRLRASHHPYNLAKKIRLPGRWDVLIRIALSCVVTISLYGACPCITLARSSNYNLNKNNRLPLSSNPTSSVCAEQCCPLLRILLEYSSDLASVLSFF